MTNEMDTKQINDALDRIFHEESQRIVFWNDPEREFHNALPFLMLEGVNIVRLDEVGALEAKIRIERDDPTGRYLLYSPAEEPEYDKDWFLDVRLYSRSFRADRASIILQDLGLATQSLRDHLAARRKFCDNKDRLQKLADLLPGGYFPFGFPPDDFSRLKKTLKDAAIEVFLCGHIHRNGDEPYEWRVGNTDAFMVGRTGGVHGVEPIVGILDVPPRGRVRWSELAIGTKRTTLRPSGWKS